MNFWIPNLVPLIFPNKLSTYNSPYPSWKLHFHFFSYRRYNYLFPLPRNAPKVPSPITDDHLEHDFDNFITSQQQLHITKNSVVTQQLIHFTSTSESPIPSVPIALSCAQHNLMERNHPNHAKSSRLL